MQFLTRTLNIRQFPGRRKAHFLQGGIYDKTGVIWQVSGYKIKNSEIRETVFRYQYSSSRRGLFGKFVAYASYRVEVP